MRVKPHPVETNARGSEGFVAAKHHPAVAVTFKRRALFLGIGSLHTANIRDVHTRKPRTVILVKRPRIYGEGTGKSPLKGKRADGW